MAHFGQLNIHSYRIPGSLTIQHTPLFALEEIRADLVIMPPGGLIGWHSHENSHELFDVMDGEGTFLVAEQRFSGGPGKSVFVPAGVRHSLHNTGDRPWMLRITYQERIYPRHIGKLLRRAIRKRLGLPV